MDTPLSPRRFQCRKHYTGRGVIDSRGPKSSVTDSGTVHILTTIVEEQQ